MGRVISIPIEFKPQNIFSSTIIATGDNNYSAFANKVRILIDGGIENFSTTAKICEYPIKTGDSIEIYGLTNYIKQDGTNYIIGITNDGTAKYTQGAAYAMNNWTQIRSGLSANQFYNFAVLNNKLYTANGGDLMFQWDGSITANVSLSANGITTHKDRLFAFEKNSSILRWSSIADGTSFPANNYTYVSRDDGDVIRAIKVYQDSLWVFKTNKTYRVIGDDFDPTEGNYSIQDYSHFMGCIGKNALAQLGDYLFYHSSKGLMICDGALSKAFDDGNKRYIGADDTNMLFPQNYWEELWGNRGNYNYSKLWGGMFQKGGYWLSGSRDYQSYAPIASNGSSINIAGLSCYIFDLNPNFTWGMRDWRYDGPEAYYETRDLKLVPTKFQPLKLHLLATGISSDGVSKYTITITYDASGTSYVFYGEFTGNKHVEFNLPNNFVDYIRVKIQAPAIRIGKMWVDINVEDLGYLNTTNTI